MNRDETSGSSGSPNDHTHFKEEENMDRTAQAGIEGAFDADPEPDKTRQQMLDDAQAAFGDAGKGRESPSGST